MDYAAKIVLKRRLKGFKMNPKQMDAFAKIVDAKIRIANASKMGKNVIRQFVLAKNAEID